MKCPTWLKIVLVFIVAFLGIILRDTIFNDLKIFGAKPDFVLILVVFYAIFNGYKKGSFLGLGLGLLEDLMCARFIGINTICMGLVGLILGTMQKRIYKDNFVMPILCVLVASIINALIYFVLCLSIGGNVVFLNMMFEALPDSVYTMCFAPFLYVFVYILNKHKDEEE